MEDALTHGSYGMQLMQDHSVVDTGGRYTFLEGFFVMQFHAAYISSYRNSHSQTYFPLPSAGST